MVMCFHPHWQESGPSYKEPSALDAKCISSACSPTYRVTYALGKKNPYIRAPVSCVSHLGCCRAPCEWKRFVYEADNDAIISLLSRVRSSSLLSYL